jgi:hypothetical protein
MCDVMFYLVEPHRTVAPQRFLNFSSLGAYVTPSSNIAFL